MIYNKLLAWTVEFATGEIEYKAIWMVEPAYLGLHELTELDHNIDTFRAFRN